MASAKTRLTKRNALEDGSIFTRNLYRANKTWKPVFLFLSEQIEAFREDVHGGMTHRDAHSVWKEIECGIHDSNINLLQEEKLLHQLGSSPLTQRIRRARRKARAVLHSSRFP